MRRNMKFKFKHFIFCFGLGYLFFSSGEIYARSPIRPPIRSAAGSKYACHCPYDQVTLDNGNIYRCGKVSKWSKSDNANCYYGDQSRKILSQPAILYNPSPVLRLDNSHQKLINSCEREYDSTCQVLSWTDH